MRSDPAEPVSRRTSVLVLVAVGLLAAAVYANALRNGFALDDEAILLHNPVVHGFGDLRGLLLEPYWAGAAELYRPVTLLSLAADWAMFGGAPGPMHAVNVLLHAIAAVLVALLVMRLGGGTVAAGMAGALFAVHPVHVEAVANVVGRAEILATLLSLAACLVYLGGAPRRLGRIAGVAALYFVALGAKEIAVTLPALLLLLDLLRTRGEPWRPKAWIAVNLPMMGGMTVALAIYLALRANASGGVMGIGAAPYLLGLPASARIATAVSLWPEYLRLLLWPRDLSAEWGPGAIDLAAWGDARVWLGLALGAGAAVVAWRGWRSGAGRWVSMAILWFAVAILPVSNLPFAVGTLLAERNLYLPSICLAFLMPPLVRAVAREHRGMRIAAGAAFALLLSLGAARTWARTPVWTSTDAVVAAVAKDHPESWLAEWTAGAILARHGRVDEALPWYLRAMEKVRFNHANMNADYVRLVRIMGRYGQAEPVLQHMIATYPRAVPSYLDLASLYVEQGRYGDAVRLLDAAERIPRWGALSRWDIRDRRALALDGAGRLDAALADRRSTLRDPRGARASAPWYHYARLLRETGDTAQARKALDAARDYAPPAARPSLTLDPLPPLQSPLIKGWGTMPGPAAPPARR